MDPDVKFLPKVTLLNTTRGSTKILYLHEISATFSVEPACGKPDIHSSQLGRFRTYIKHRLY